ncbi:hypothetical protein [Gracilibacillus timonensis]|uniref:hypothetical protein n=1 Tax=Gracilibacillus timonensis TaxID=1816696 RepID=UPI0008246737|nr:hypothetical protein [Gracilibacillus timonensis]
MKKFINLSMSSFFISLILLSVWLDRETLTIDTNGLSSLSTMSYSSYFYMLLQYSIGITILVVMIRFLLSWIKKKGKEDNKHPLRTYH